MPSREDVPVGTTRRHLPSIVDQDPLASDPMGGYPLDQYTVHTSPPSTVLSKGVRTLVPLIPQASANGASFCDFAQSRIAPDGSRIVPGAVTERLWVRVNMKIAIDPNGNPLTGVLNGLLTTLSNVAPFNYALNTPQAVQVELDVGPVGTPNVIFGQSTMLNFLPQSLGIVVPLFGGAPFLANGARVFVTSTTSGIVITDVRTLLRQSRA